MPAQGARAWLPLLLLLQASVVVQGLARREAPPSSTAVVSNATGSNSPRALQQQAAEKQKLAPFEDAVAACKYCEIESHTKKALTQPNGESCTCFSYENDGSTAGKEAGWTMWCAADERGEAYAASLPNACTCKVNNPRNLGKSTCDPIEAEEGEAEK